MGLHYKSGYEQYNFIVYCECVMQGSKKKDWNKWAWIIVWWRGCDGEELGNWTSGGLSMSGDYSVLFIQKSSRDFLHYWDYVFGTGSSEVPVALFWACLWKKMLNLRSSTACLFSLNPQITEQKNFLLLWNSVHIVPTFLNYFLNTFF